MARICSIDRFTARSRKPQVLRDLSAGKPARVQRYHMALTRGEPLEHHVGDARDLGVVFPPHRRNLGRRRAVVGELEIVDGDVDDALTFRAPALAGDLTMCRRAKPVVDLALHLADAGVLGARTRLLKGILDLLGGRG